MPDTYRNFAALAQQERSERDYSISFRDSGTSIVIAAPHGGGFEPGTSEFARAIADETFSYYLSEGRKPRGNAVLHITSTNFDEPQCLALLGSSSWVLAIHGEESDSDVVYLGGLHSAAQRLLETALERGGFAVREHPDRNLQGIDVRNICNLGRSRRGVQLELSAGLRASFFANLTRSGRANPTSRFFEFASIVRTTLLQGGLE